MTAQVFSFLRRRRAPRDWTAQELAEFYRVESILIQAGLWVVSARGLSDEGEPWFVFCRADDDEVIIHFARIDGRYVICAPAYGENATGHDFRALVKGMIERNPLMPPRPRGDNLFLHPATLLVVLVATALLKSGHAAEAAPAKQAVSDTIEGKHRDISATGAFATAYPVATAGAALPEAQYELLILAAMTAAMTTPADAAPMAIAAPNAAFLSDFDSQSHQPTTTPPPLDNWSTLPTVIAETGGVSQLAPMPSSLNVASPTGTASSVSTHAIPAPDTTLVGTISFSGVGSVHPLPGAAASTTMPQDPSAGAQLVPLSALSNIPKADLDLLHALSVPNMVAYTANLPAAFSNVVQTGVHTDTVSSNAGHAPSGAATDAHGLVATSVPQITTPLETAPVPVAPPTTNISTVLAIVGQFQAIEVHPALVFTANAAIFYDVAAVDANLSAVRSVTYNFGDGYSISLVGLPSELAQAGAHVT